MEDSLKIPVTYKGEELEFDAKLVPYGYIHRLLIDVEGIEVYFEPDEDRQYRAILSDEALSKNLTPNIELIKLIVEVLNQIGKS
jgi:phage-related protein